MSKKVSILILALVCLCVLTGCFCQHEFAPADCVNPQTCTKCDKTEGEALGHVWLAATCTEAKTCEICGAKDGEPKGHTWTEATCTEAKTCSSCKQTEGEALGHAWADATTEAPQTCTVCMETEGERIITDPRFTTAEALVLMGKWGCSVDLTGEDMDLPDFPGTLNMILALDFGNAGDMKISCEIGNQEAFMESMVGYTLEVTYNDFKQQGVDKATADQMMQTMYGMSMEEYVRAMLGEIDFNEMFAAIYDALDVGGVYYLEDGKLYVGQNWQTPMEQTLYRMEGNVLYIDELQQELGIQNGFTRMGE